MVTSNDSDQWMRIAGETQVLLRSRIEISRILRATIDGDIPLLAHLKEIDQLFLGKLLHISTDQNFIFVGYSDNKAANAAIFEANESIFGFNYKSAYVEFPGLHPVENYEHGQAIRFDFPRALFIRQRRIHKRISVIPVVPLSCIADSDGITPFDAKVVDISMGGLGAIIFSNMISLAPGTLLKGCKVTLPDRQTVIVDIEIKYAIGNILFDGRMAQRAGCSFIGPPDAIGLLQKVFMLDLETHND